MFTVREKGDASTTLPIKLRERKERTPVWLFLKRVTRHGATKDTQQLFVVIRDDRSILVVL